MFHFAPPAKVARTQRGSAAANTSAAQLVAHSSNESALMLSTTRDTTSRLHSRAMELGISNIGRTSVLHENRHSVAGALSGIGKNFAWIVTPETDDSMIITVWNILLPGSPQARCRLSPKFGRSNGERLLPTFVKELQCELPAGAPLQPLLLVAIADGSCDVLNVNSLVGKPQHLIPSSDDIRCLTMQLSTDHQRITEVATICASGASVVAAGTDLGQLILQRVSSDSQVPSTSIRLDLNQPDVTFAASSANATQRSSWISWITGGRLGTTNSVGKGTRNATTSATAATTTVTKIIPLENQNHRILVALSSGLLLCVDLSSGASQSCMVSWAIDVATAAVDSDTQPAVIDVLAACDSRHDNGGQILVLLRSAGSTVRDQSALVLLTISATTAIILNRHVLLTGKLVGSKLAGYASAIFCPQDGHHVIVLHDQLRITVNHLPGVRQPCDACDVEHLAPTAFTHSATVIAAAIADGGRQLLLTSNGEPPYDVTGDPRAYQQQQQSPMNAIQAGAVAAGVANAVSTQFSSLLSSTRLEDAGDVDNAIRALSDDILNYVPLNSANWARVDPNVEDANLFSYVTRMLGQRQQDHLSLIQSVISWITMQPELAANSSPSIDTLSKLVSDQEKFQCLVILRSMQNGIAWTTASGGSQLELQRLVSRVLQLCGGQVVEETFVSQRVQALLRDAVLLVAASLRSTPRYQVMNQIVTAPELCYSQPDHVCNLLRALNTIISERWQGATLGSSSMEPLLVDTVIVGSIFETLVDHVTAQRASSSLISELLQRNSSSSNAAWVLEERLWTASGFFSATREEHDATHLAPSLLDQLQLLSDALAAVHTVADPTLVVDPALQLAPLQVLHRLVISLLHFDMARNAANVDEGRRTQFSKWVMQWFIRSPFVAARTGYPFGTPQAAAPFQHSKQDILQVGRSIALRFGLHEITSMFTIAVPYSANHHVGHFTGLVESLQELKRIHSNTSAAQDDLLRHIVQVLVSQKREEELRLLSSAVSHVVENSALIVNSYLQRNAPGIVWQADPRNFEAVRQEGALSNPDPLYGDTLLSHRSRSLSVAKLAWIAVGAPSTLKQAADLKTDRLIVQAQGTYLGETHANVVLTAVEAVTELINKVPSETSDTADAWTAAAQIAARISDPTARDELHAAIIRRALLFTGSNSLVGGSAPPCPTYERILSIPSDYASEMDASWAMRQLPVCKVLLARESALRNPLALQNAISNSNTALDDEKLRLVHRILQDWLVHIATTAPNLVIG